MYPNKVLFIVACYAAPDKVNLVAKDTRVYVWDK